MAHSHKKHLTDRSVSKFMKNYANRKIRQISVDSYIPNHKYFRRISNPYYISDDYCFGWEADNCSSPEIYVINRRLTSELNDDPWFRTLRNK